MTDQVPSGDAAADKAQADKDTITASDEEKVAADEQAEADLAAAKEKEDEVLKTDEDQLASDKAGDQPDQPPAPGPRPQPGPTPSAPTPAYYQFQGGDPSTIDTTQYQLAHVTDDAGNPLYTFAGDVNPGDENGAPDGSDWVVYTGPVTRLSPAEQANRGVTDVR